MIIGGLQKMSLTDYPGQISAIIFTKGCNLRCPYCYNVSLNAIESGEKSDISEAEILEFLEKRKGKLDAVVITGGEPTLHSSLEGFMAKVKDKGFLVKLDTNGTNPKAIKRIWEKGLIDYVAIDLKGPPEKYSQVTGTSVDMDEYKQTLDHVIKSRIPHEFRSTMVPSLLNKDDIHSMGEMIQGADRWYLQKFVSNLGMIDDALKDTLPFTDKEMEEMVEVGKEYVKECEYR
jgi:pyruvate formate lyase activating enzyme